MCRWPVTGTANRKERLVSGAGHRVPGVGGWVPVKRVPGTSFLTDTRHPIPGASFLPHQHESANNIHPLVYSIYLGSNSLDAAFGVAVNSLGQAFVTGETVCRPTFPETMRSRCKTLTQ